MAGDGASAGTVIFVESIRWLGVRWGMGSCRRGLRQAGFTGDFLYWRWHSTWRGCLVLPAIMASGLLEQQSRRLAEFVAQAKREGKGPIHLIGYSCGGYIALRALELLADGVTVESATLCAAAFDPRRDLSLAASRVRRKLVVCSSPFDLPIVGLGTLIFATADRRHTFSAGMVGLRGDQPANVEQIRWRPEFVAGGWMGEHFTACAAGLFRDRIAPMMGINSQNKGD